MRVLKFGGTSVSNADNFVLVSNIVRESFNNNSTSVVLSAPARVTNLLIDLLNSKKDNNTDKVKETWNKIYFIFDEIIENIAIKQPNFDLTKVKELINKEFDYINKLLDAIGTIGFCPDNLYARIVSVGEVNSIIIFDHLLRAQGLSTYLIDPVKVLVSDGNYLESQVDIGESTERYSRLNISREDIILMPGFIAGNRNGELVIVGRNGSDYSASILAAISLAKSCEIFTDVDGVYTCDPNLVRSAYLIPELTYKEAMELSYFGASVIHPRTIAPLMSLNIPCYIKNTHNSNAAGSLISNKRHNKDDKVKVKGITYLNDVVMFNVSGPALKGTVGIASKIFKAISNANASILFVTQSSSEYNISFCVHSKYEYLVRVELLNSFENLFAKGGLDQLDIIRDVSIVTVVGEGMHNSKGISARYFSSLSDQNINVIAIAQGSSERSISTVVNTKNAVKAVKALHESLFNMYKSCNVILVGLGLVGSELAKQIVKQRDHLLSRGYNVSLRGLVNSSKVLFSPLEINDFNIVDILNTNGESTDNNVGSIIKWVKDNSILNPVIVDCTSSEIISNSYVKFLQAGCHIVTANKKANTSNYKYYQDLRSISLEQHRKFLYDTNVGAGLPVIENIQNLINAGDNIIRFQGILSGSLSYIFGALEEGMTISEATIKAGELGFTEPDPRDDLSGMDVARKLLIIAREYGLELELNDIILEGVLPDGFDDGCVTSDFINKLPELDQYYLDLVNKAKKENKVLRFIGSIEHNKCIVRVEAVDVNDPLAKVSGGENALAFYTRYYSPIPLLLRGYGAGKTVTAAGLFGDLLRCTTLGGSL